MITDRVRSHRGRLAALTAAAVALAACGSSGDDTATTTEPTDTTTDDTTDATTAPTDETTDATTNDTTGDTTDTADGAAVDTLEGVRGAAVQIVAVGTFVDPEFGQYETAGAGSGFVISADGVAVTNHHVVGGAGLLEVYVDGEDEPRNARVLGVSECSDLAVIDIAGDPLPYLQWFDGEPAPGLTAYSAGFPLGDPEFTLTRGVVSKADAGGDTSWASNDHVIEHDANIQPGNSGGALVTEDGQVIAVNYATDSATNQSQFLAIAADEARPIVERLSDGDDVNSTGMNGQVVASEDGSLTGLWVSAIESGSPADEAGVQPGDLVVKIAGVSVGVDGTMRDYCDVLRSHSPDAELPIEVLRLSTGEGLSGELNGDLLEVTSAPEPEPTTPAAAGPYSGETMEVSDDLGLVSVEVPVEWAQVDGREIEFDGVTSPSVWAAADLQAFATTWSEPGMKLTASAEWGSARYTTEQLLDVLAPLIAGGCDSVERTPYDDGLYLGHMDAYSGCGSIGADYVVVAIHSVEGNAGALLEIQIVDDADFVVAQNLIASFLIHEG